MAVTGAAEIGRRLTQFTDFVHPFFTLDPTEVDNPRLVHLTLRGIEVFVWFVRIIECSHVGRSMLQPPPAGRWILCLVYRGRLSPICLSPICLWPLRQLTCPLWHRDAVRAYMQSSLRPLY